MEKKLRVGILGATGMVGQRFIFIACKITLGFEVSNSSSKVPSFSRKDIRSRQSADVGKMDTPNAGRR